MDKQSEIQEGHLNILLKHYETNNQALAHLSMRYGKTKLTLDLLKELYDYNHTVLIAYPDNQIKESWQNECIKWNYSNPNITYVNFSSLWKYEDSIFDIVICDEIHSLSVNELDTLHIIMTNSAFTRFLGLSGTISKDTQRRTGVPIIVEYTTLDGIEDEILADYNITVHFVPLDTTIKTKNSKGKLLTEKQKYDNYTYIINKFRKEGKDTMHLTLNRNRLSTASLGKMNYLKKLLLTLNDKRIVVFAGLTEVADRIGIPTYHNKSKNDDNFQKFQTKEISKLGLAMKGRMGVSFTDLDSVILLNATSNEADTAQLLNRAIKLDYTGKVADLHIIALNEETEVNKVKKTLSLLDKTKIKYLYI